MTKWQIRRFLILWTAPMWAGVLLITFPLNRVLVNGQDLLGAILIVVGVVGVVLDEWMTREGYIR